MSTANTGGEPPHDPAGRRNLIIVVTLLVIVAVVLLIFGTITVMESLDGRLHPAAGATAASGRL